MSKREKGRRTPSTSPLFFPENLRWLIGDLLGLGETDSVVSEVEMSVVHLNESVSQNEGVGQLRRELHSDNSELADGLSKGGDLENVIVRSDGVDVSTNVELKVGVGGDLAAVDGAGELGGDLVDELGGSDDDWRAGVDDGAHGGNSERGVSELDVVEGDSPIFLEKVK